MRQPSSRRPPPVNTTATSAAATSAPETKAGWSPITAANSGPAPRYDHSVLVNPVRQQIVVFGGRGASTFGDTWVTTDDKAHVARGEG